MLPVGSSPLWWLAPPPSPPLRGGTMGVGQWRPFEFMAAAERKPYNRASPGKTSKPRCARGNAPLLVLTHHLSPGGGTLLSVQLLNSLAYPSIGALKPPPPGWQANVICKGAQRPENHVRRFPVERCRRQKGCISDGRSPVVRFSIPRSGIIILIAAGGI